MIIMGDEGKVERYNPITRRHQEEEQGDELETWQGEMEERGLLENGEDGPYKDKDMVVVEVDEEIPDEEIPDADEEHKRSRFSLWGSRKGSKDKDGEHGSGSPSMLINVFPSGEHSQESYIKTVISDKSPAQTPKSTEKFTYTMEGCETLVDDDQTPMKLTSPKPAMSTNDSTNSQDGQNEMNNNSGKSTFKKLKSSLKNKIKGAAGSTVSGRIQKRLTFSDGVIENEGDIKPSPKRRDSQACEFEADDEGFCIDGFHDDEDDTIDGYTDEEDETLSDGEENEEDEIDGNIMSSSSLQDQANQPRTIDETKSIPKYQRIAQEMMTTEDTYVKRLCLIHTGSQKFIESCVLTKEQYENIFKNLSEIYSFHRDDFLPRIRERIDKWDHQPRIGDIMKAFGPFLKLYTPFVKNIDNSRKLIQHHKKSSTKFANVLQEIENSSEAGRIKLSDYMTEPMTRLLRYKLLLSEYLRKLPEDHIDRADTEAALDITSEAAQHVNESIREEDNMARLAQIQESLADEFVLVEPSRIFIKDGRLAMVDTARGRHLERHMFLFNNLLLVCQPQIMGMKYKIHKKIPMKHITLENDNDDHHFVVMSRKIVAEFYGSTGRETGEWVKAITDALNKFRQEHPSDEVNMNTSLEDELGHRAPRLVRRDSSICCNLCGLQFVSIRRTRNHCYACGQLYCQRCSGQTVRLAYKDWQCKRVCDRCYSALWDDAVCKSVENLLEDEWKWQGPRPKSKSKRSHIGSSRKCLPLESRSSEE